MDYMISNNLLEYSRIINYKIGSSECKHIAINTPRDIAITFELLSAKVNYDYCYMSQGNDYSVENNKQYVYKMSLSESIRPAKYVITKDGRVWADNTHTSLSALLKFGEDARILDSDFYIIDLRNNITILNPPATFTPSICQIVIDNALKIQHRIDRGWRPVSLNYTIRDLFFYDNYQDFII